MPAPSDGPFSRYPFSALLAPLDSAGRLSDFLKGVGRRPIPVAEPLPAAIPIGESMPVAKPLVDWVPREQAEAEVAKAHQDLLKEKARNQQLEAERDEARRDRRTGDTQLLLKDASDENKILRDENRELKAKNESHLRKNESLHAQLIELREEVAYREQGRQQAPESHGGFRVREERLAPILQFIFPRLVFTPASIWFLVERANNLKQTLARLRELNDNPGAVRGEAVENTDGWREQRFGTQGSTRDRIYYRFDPGGASCSIKLSEKKLQKRDFDNLR